MNQDIEATLCVQRWRDPPLEFLEHALAAALQERARTAKRRRLWDFIPRPLRLPLAACWLLAFFFRITTPEPIPQSTLDASAKLPPLTPAQLLVNRQQIEQLVHELLHPPHHGPIPPL